MSTKSIQLVMNSRHCLLHEPLIFFSPILLAMSSVYLFFVLAGYMFSVFYEILFANGYFYFFSY